MGRFLPCLCALLLVLGGPAAVSGDGHKHGPRAQHADDADADATPAVVSGAALAAADVPAADGDLLAGTAPNLRKSTAGAGLAPFDSPGAALLYRVATALGADGADGLPKPPSPAEMAADAGAAMLG